MDPQAVARDLQRSRERLRSIMIPDEGGGGAFPRSATMRFLLDGQRRGPASMVLGGLFSLFLGRRLKKNRRAGRSRGRRGVTGALLALLSGRDRR